MRGKWVWTLRKAVFLAVNAGTYLHLRRHHPGALRIRTDMWIDEKLLLYRLARGLPEGSEVVEIGSYLGASTALLAAGCGPRGCRVTAVDTWQNDAMSEGAWDTFETFTCNTAPYRDTITVLRGMSADVAPGFNRSIDLLFVDANHAYAGCKVDLVNWLPKVKAGGMVVCHDIGWAGGVRRAVSEELRPFLQAGLRRLPNMGWGRWAGRGT